MGWIEESVGGWDVGPVGLSDSSEDIDYKRERELDCCRDLNIKGSVLINFLKP